MILRGLWSTHAAGEAYQPLRAHFQRADYALQREADARIRTGDPFITSEVLYQLSYVGTRSPMLAMATEAVSV